MISTERERFIASNMAFLIFGMGFAAAGRDPCHASNSDYADRHG
jgi:hypothetical protein